MGVKGLWKLVQPVGRPVMLETMEGRAMAIDSSIWIYQFQATMRDKEGRGLVNAHLLGFLRRICKLLFYGIKPVFVFDGGVPALKKSTIAERKKKKAGAAASHAQVAERLLAAQLRREALKTVEGRRGQSSSSRPTDEQVIVDENTVYLADLDDPDITAVERRREAAIAEKKDPAQAKKNKWIDHDPYKLPEIDERVMTRPTSSTAPDPRLATEEDLRAFIEEMKPSDFDITSPDFRDLPTGVQYEIIGDLRLKSRQTSYKRLQSMIKNARDALDFSKAQIKGLQTRNHLTQQLLTATGTISKAHVQIPVRIASERNKQYMLVRNEEDPMGGWVLAMRNSDGTASKPIEIDIDPKDEIDPDEDDDMEEVPLGESQLPKDQTFSLSSIGSRRPGKAFQSPPTKKAHAQSSLRMPLFQEEEDGDEDLDPVATVWEEDPELHQAIQESLEEDEARQLREAIVESKKSQTQYTASTSAGEPSSSRISSTVGPSTTQTISDDDDLYIPLHQIPSRLNTALSIANTTPKSSPWSGHLSSGSSGKGKSPQVGPSNLTTPTKPSKKQTPAPIAVDSSDDDMEEVEFPTLPTATDDAYSAVPDTAASGAVETDIPADHHNNLSLSMTQDEDTRPSPTQALEDDEDDFGAPVMLLHDEQQVQQVPLQTVLSKEAATAQPQKLVATKPAPSTLLTQPSRPLLKEVHSAPTPQVPLRATTPKDIEPFEPMDIEPIEGAPVELPARTPEPESPPHLPTATTIGNQTSPSEDPLDEPPEDDLEEVEVDAVAPEPESQPAEEDWDAAQEMDIAAEEGEFARFASQIKGRNLADVRREIDDEIRTLNAQRKQTLRDSEDVNQQMVSQIMVMLRLFGIPYITAPMEAEAQCAELVALRLVDGIITDDSDVFLFGGTKILKNMFNQSQTVELFLLRDLTRELDMERDKLILLAYLLGSDYVDGLPGVGPVIAMEILKEFSGNDGLHKFKDWWRKVQTGKDNPNEASDFKKRFKKRFKDLFLPEDWPNSLVRDAYLHPTVDSSDEPFKWGFPDLDGLRSFLRDELSWNQHKTDELLLPIIRKMGQRTKADAANKQSTLDPFFDAGPGAEPRRRDMYASKRLQKVVSDYRKQQSQEQQSSSTTGGSSSSEGEEESRATKKPRTATRGRGRGKGKATTQTRSKASGAKGKGRKKKVAQPASESEEEEVDDDEAVVDPNAEPTAPLAVELRPPKTTAKTKGEAAPGKWRCCQCRPDFANRSCEHFLMASISNNTQL